MKQSERIKDEMQVEENDLRWFALNTKYNRAVNSEHFVEVVIPELINNKLTVKEFNHNSFRITNGINTIDYFPCSKKLLIHKGNKWIKVNSDIVNSILNILNPKAGGHT